MFTDTEGKKKVRWRRWIAIAVFAMVGILLSSLVFVPPHTMVAVKGWDGITALINESDSTSLKLKWPYIPNVIGYKEETVKLPDVKDVSTSFAFYTADEVTGEPEDKMKARAFFVDVRFEVVDWEKYLKIDLDKLNEERRQAGPWYPLIKERAGLIAEPITSVIKSGGSVDRFGRPIKTEEGYPAMDVSTRVNYTFSELSSRRNFLITLLEHYDLKTAEEIIKYLKEEIPWYYFAGPSAFEQLAQQWKDTIEATLSNYSENIGQEAANQRVIAGEDRIVLFRHALQAWQYEGFLMEKERQLKNIELQQKLYLDSYNDPQLEKVLDGFGKFLESQDRGLEFVADEQNLQTLFGYFLNQVQINIAFAFRADEIETLNKSLAEAEKKFAEFPPTEEDKLKAEEVIEGIVGLIKQELGDYVELWQLSGQDLNSLFEHYLATHELKNKLSPHALDYIGVKISAAYIEALADKVKEAEEFLRDTEIAREFYLEFRVGLQGQKIDMNQMLETIQDYLSGKQLLLQQSFGLISLSWQEARLEFQEKQWKENIEQTIKLFKHYSTSDSELALMIRRVVADENEALWLAAIEQVFNGEDVIGLRPYWIHEIEEGDTLAGIVGKYEVDWPLVFHQLDRMIIYQSLPLEKRAEFDYLLAQGIKTGDYQKAYEFVKDTHLEKGETIIVWKVMEFSQEWFEMQEEYREKREQVIRQYAYPIVEKFVPNVIEEYFYSPNSPWVDYIENTYGVELLEVKIRIENDEIVDKGGSIKLEYYDLYLSRAEDWIVEEEEE